MGKWVNQWALNVSKAWAGVNPTKILFFISYKSFCSDILNVFSFFCFGGRELKLVTEKIFLPARFFSCIYFIDRFGFLY